jgi:alanine racemase
MNMTMVDVTHIPGVEVGAIVTLLGEDGDETVTAEHLANWAETINYEIVSRIHSSIPRIEDPRG